MGQQYDLLKNIINKTLIVKYGIIIELIFISDGIIYFYYSVSGIAFFEAINKMFLVLTGIIGYSSAIIIISKIEIFQKLFITLGKYSI